MSIDYVFILAAGLGTRMGELGKIIPKPLWPVFEKSLLELQLDYVNSLGIKKVFINTHHQGQLVQKVIGELGRSDVVISHEEQLQDIGGGIHQIAKKVDYQGKMLVLNCDQFLWLTQNDLMEMRRLLTPENYVTLTSITVDPKLGYNGIKIKEDSKFLGLLLGEELKGLNSIRTYGGVCLIDLEHLPARSGRSKFFESIVSLESCPAMVWDASKQEYWDFGTKERFILSHLELLSEFNRKKSLKNYCNFLQFLIKRGAIKTEYIHDQFYGPENQKQLQLKGVTLSKDCDNQWHISSAQELPSFLS